MLTGVGSHDRGPYHYGDFSFRFPRALQFTRQLADDGRLRFVGIYDRVNELKNIRSRRRTLVIGALVVAFSMLLLGALLNVFRQVYLGAVPAQLPQDAAASIYDTLVGFIRLNLRAVLVLFLAIAAIGWVTGPAPAPSAVRPLSRATILADRWKIAIATSPLHPRAVAQRRIRAHFVSP